MHITSWCAHGLCRYVSEFCTDCGAGAQLADGTFVFIVTVRFGPDWEPNDHSVSVTLFRSISLAQFR